MKLTHNQPEKIIQRAVKYYTDFLAVTYGPVGKKILIVESPYSIKAVDDGHMAAEAFEMESEYDNAVISYIREATSRTNTRVGDGTTTAAIIAGAIVAEVYKDLDNELIAKKNYASMAREIERAVIEAVKWITSKSKDVKTREELYAIAYNSFPHERIAELISDTVFKIGKDGVIAIEDSQSVDSTCEIVSGLEIKKGFASPYLINTPKNEVMLKNPAVLVVNKRIETAKEIVPFLQKFITEKKELVIFAEGYGEDVTNFLVLNKVRGMINVNFVEAPLGEKESVLKDISVVAGATMVEAEKGMKLEEIGVDVLGSADTIVSSKDTTRIIGGKGKKLKEHVKYLKALEIQPYEKDRMEKRIAALTGGIAVIRIGANTENEQKAIKAKTEDAINSTQVAYKDGVSKGAGKTYEEIKTSSDVLNEALKAPRKKLIENGEEFLDKDVLDPTGVLVAALETAASIACGLITTGGIITTKRKPEKAED